MPKWRPQTVLLLLPFVGFCAVLVMYFHTHYDAGFINRQAADYRNVLAEATINVTETSEDGKYGRNYFSWAADSWPKGEVFTSVCLATQGTPNYLHWVELHARLWKGPISVGVYAPGRDFMAAYNRIMYLRKCYPHVKELVAFHIVFPLEHPPVFIEKDAVEQECLSDGVEKVFQTVLMNNLTTNSKENYPQNHMRNTARNACPTRFTMTVDMDMIPWAGMSAQMDTFFRDIEFQNSAYIVPVYEISSDVEQFPPSSKLELISLLGQKKARIFHSKVFTMNQLNSNLKNWEKKKSANQSAISVAHKVPKYQEFWEPILVLPSSAPKFFERFVGYGFTRNTHVYFLHLLNFHFNVLDNAFLSHRGFQERNAIYNTKRKRELSQNSKLYKLFKEEMSRKYES